MDSKGSDDTLRMRRIRIILIGAFCACLEALFRLMRPSYHITPEAAAFHFALVFSNTKM